MRPRPRSTACATASTRCATPASRDPDAALRRALHRPRSTTISTCRARWRSRGRCCAATCRPRCKRATLLAFDRVFGLGLADWAAEGRGRCPTTCARSPRRAPRRATAKQLGRGRPPARRARRPRGWEMEDGADGYTLQAVADRSVDAAIRDEARLAATTARATASSSSSRAISRAACGVPEIARTLQAALDDWDARGAGARARSPRSSNAGRMPDATPFDRDARDGAAAARLPVGRRLGLRQSRRAGAHGARRGDAAGILDRSADVPGRLRPHARRRATTSCIADEAWGIDFEAEVAVITGDVPMGADAERSGARTSGC